MEFCIGGGLLEEDPGDAALEVRQSSDMTENQHGNERCPDHSRDIATMDLNPGDSRDNVAIQQREGVTDSDSMDITAPGESPSLQMVDADFDITAAENPGQREEIMAGIVAGKTQSQSGIDTIDEIDFAAKKNSGRQDGAVAVSPSPGEDMADNSISAIKTRGRPQWADSITTMKASGRPGEVGASLAGIDDPPEPPAVPPLTTPRKLSCMLPEMTPKMFSVFTNMQKSITNLKKSPWLLSRSSEFFLMSTAEI